MPKSLILTLLEEQDEEQELKKKLRSIVMALASAVPWKFEPGVDGRFTHSQHDPKYKLGYVAVNPEDKTEIVAVGVWQNHDWEPSLGRVVTSPKMIQTVYSFLRAHDGSPRLEQLDLAEKINKSLMPLKARTRSFTGIAVLVAHEKMARDLQNRLSNFFYTIEK